MNSVDSLIDFTTYDHDRLMSNFTSFIAKFSELEYVTNEGNNITIDYISYRFTSEYRVVFRSNKFMVKLKFTAKDVGNNDISFSIYFGGEGLIETSVDLDSPFNSFYIDTMPGYHFKKFIHVLMYKTLFYSSFMEN
ncbi:hypothetical protein V4T70_002920 [Vibrio vulnificus]|uniref:hypothetical protein n=1 Tax=Vibrio vulnificus TaxID=672 RepID=UPI0024DF7546|nr:hypothetical protein [Vibrio vulnificus]EIX4879130.1 hypothetical protein [Vibrio vulnificus]EKO5176038.1 hypothetical protein [Vibrio vulnificus]EKO5193523.1 hypothetical protein [Vibrio vulnificus]ELP3502483.1 hypothetical protein [Vibrio vulnificus]ELP3551283.1 hypothetical protein [Vibrio vulnificus]